MSAYTTKISFQDDPDKIKQGLRILARIIIREFMDKSSEVTKNNEYKEIVQSQTKRLSAYQGVKT